MLKQIRDLQVYPERISDIPEITDLMQKCAQGKICDVEILLNEGADVMAEDAQGLTALLYVIRSGMQILLN